MSRLRDLAAFYGLLDELAARLGGPKPLRDCHGRMPWPRHGVYFFYEPGEERTTSGKGPRVVRVGTHALKANSASSLWNRLSQHRGPASSGAGNHRGSVFRELVGEAIISRGGLAAESWGVGRSAGVAGAKLGLAASEVRSAEREIEISVSSSLGQMCLLWVEVDDPAGPGSLRGVIERGAIALLSNAGRDPLDPPSAGWLGKSSRREDVCASGLWNIHHVSDTYDPRFLESLARAVGST